MAAKASYRTSIALLVSCLVSATIAKNGIRYTVWSSVIFSRTGERTPEVLGYDPVTLTSVGAQQQYSAGQYFRQRYLESYNNFTTNNGIDLAPMPGMSPEIPDVQKLYVQALDEQYSVASAQAFLQGLYPPVSFTSNSSELQTIIDPTALLANNTYVAAPLGGYQYVQIHSSGMYDPNFVYVSGNLECPAFIQAVEDFTNTAEFAVMVASTEPLYQKIGPKLLSGVLTEDKWGYENAYAIYDYLSYQYEHNSTVAALFNSSQFTDQDTGISYLDYLRYYSDQQQYGWFGNLDVSNEMAGEGFGAGLKGSISTIAGNTLAAKMLGQLQTAIQYQGEYYQLNLLFADFEPLLSLFALFDLPSLNSDFYGMPDFGSVAVFELYSYAATGDNTFPSEDELWVRFYFRNGTASDEPFQAYSLFNYGPDNFEMRWVDFEAAMMNVAVGDIGMWCEQCSAGLIATDRVFCSFWNSSDSSDGTLTSATTSNGTLSPAVSGVIGAVIALVIAGVIFAFLMVLAGVRFHRVKSHKGDLGGFKGSQKLASDRDLTLPKGGAVVGATIETPGSPVPGGHERVGSWELKQNDLPNIAAGHPAMRRPSLEDDDVGDVGDSPFRDPVRPDERV